MKKNCIWTIFTCFVGLMFMNGCASTSETTSTQSRMLEESVAEDYAEVFASTEEAQVEDAAVPEEASLEVAADEQELAPVVSVEMRSEQRYSQDWSTPTVTFTYHEISVSPEEHQALADALAAYSQTRKDDLGKKADELNVAAQEELKKNPDDFYGFYIGSQVETMRSDSRIYSMMETEYSYGDDNSDTTYYGAVFDSKSGKRLALSDICIDKNLFLNTVVNYCASDLQAAYPEAEFYDGYEDIIVTMAQNEEPWFMDATGLTFVYKNGTVADIEGINGPMVAHVPYAQVQNCMKAEYLPGETYGVTAVPVNYPVILLVNGQEKQFCIHRTYSEYYSENISFSYGPDLVEFGEYARLDNAYLLKLESGTYFLFDIDHASDDYETFLYRFNENSLEEMDHIYAHIDDSNINGENFDLGFRVDMLGTYTSYMGYTIDETGHLHTDETEYVLGNAMFNLKTIENLPIEKNGKMTTLPAGSEIRLISTDNETRVNIVIVSTLEEATLYVERGKGDNYYSICINGIDQFECFEELPYAG